MALIKGDKIPETLGKDQDGKEVKASNYAGKKLILYFYSRKKQGSKLNLKPFVL